MLCMLYTGTAAVLARVQHPVFVSAAVAAATVAAASVAAATSTTAAVAAAVAAAAAAAAPFQLYRERLFIYNKGDRQYLLVIYIEVYATEQQ